MRPTPFRIVLLLIVFAFVILACTIVWRVRRGQVLLSRLMAEPGTEFDSHELDLLEAVIRQRGIFAWPCARLDGGTENRIPSAVLKRAEVVEQPSMTLVVVDEWAAGRRFANLPNHVRDAVNRGKSGSSDVLALMMLVKRKEGVNIDEIDVERLVRENSDEWFLVGLLMNLPGEIIQKHEASMRVMLCRPEVGDGAKIILLRRLAQDNVWKHWFDNDASDLRRAYQNGGKRLKEYISEREPRISKLPRGPNSSG